MLAWRTQARGDIKRHSVPKSAGLLKKPTWPEARKHFLKGHISLQAQTGSYLGSPKLSLLSISVTPKPGGNSSLTFAVYEPRPVHLLDFHPTGLWLPPLTSGHSIHPVAVSPPALPDVTGCVVAWEKHGLKEDGGGGGKNKHALHEMAWGCRNSFSRPFDLLSWVFSVPRSTETARGNHGKGNTTRLCHC